MRHHLFTYLCTFFLLCACNNDNTNTSSSTPSPSQNNDSNTVKVYVETLNEPFIIQRHGGRIGGFEYELLHAIAEKQGLKLHFEPVSWDAMFQAIESGEADVIAASITATAERAQKMDFTTPHLHSSTAALISKSNTEIKSFSDLNGMTIGIQPGTTSEALAKTLFPNSQLMAEPNTLSMVNSLVVGKIPVIMGDRYMLSFYQKQQHRGVELQLLSDESQAAEPLAFGVRKGQPELLKQLNDGLAAIRADGTYDRLIQQWFGNNVQPTETTHN